MNELRDKRTYISLDICSVVDKKGVNRINKLPMFTTVQVYYLSLLNSMKNKQNYQIVYLPSN